MRCRRVLLRAVRGARIGRGRGGGDVGRCFGWSSGSVKRRDGMGDLGRMPRLGLAELTRLSFRGLSPGAAERGAARD